MSTNRRTHHHHHLWDVVATLVLIFEAASCSSIEFYEPSGLEIEDYSPQFLTYVDQVIQDLVQNFRLISDTSPEVASMFT